MENEVITSVPGEIIEYILEDKRIEFHDLFKLSLTCKQILNIIANSNKLWKTKFFQRWPALREVYQEIGRLDGTVTNWKDEAEASIKIRRTMQHLLSLMSSKHYEKQELCNSLDLQEFEPLINPEEGAHPAGYHIVIDELISIIKCPMMTSNLTHRYYAFKIIRHLKQNFLKSVWEKFVNLPPKEQVLDYAATLVSQWSQPERQISYSYVSNLIDNIAEQTKQLLKEQYPDHSIFSVTEEQFNYWKHNNIDDNQWNVIETKQVVDALCKVLFQKLDFHGNNEMYYSSENSFIDRVLEHKRGIPITLAIVFESVARRLGIRCEPVSFPSHFLLRWKENYTSPESQDMENYYIDVFYGGRFLTKKNCPRIGGTQRCPIEKYNVHKAASAVEVVMRMANNLEVAVRQHTHLNGRLAKLRSAIELQHMIQPNDIDAISLLGHFYKRHRIDSSDLIDKLLHLSKDMDVTERADATAIAFTFYKFQRHMQPKEVEPKKRVAELKYAVGLIMMHKVHRYSCVIIGWTDTKCWQSAEWMTEMNLNELTYGANQPFYYVLVDDGSRRYAAQENLFLPMGPEWINHYEVGRYFYKFCGTHYLPNEETLREYPDDEKARNDLLFAYQNGMELED